MKRSLNEQDEYKNDKIVNFQNPTNIKNKEIKKTNEEEIKEINDLLYDILEDDNIDVIIKVNTKNKEIYVNEYNNIDNKNRKYIYIKDNLTLLIDSIYDNFMYKEIHSFELYLDGKNIFADKKEWPTQLFNEIEYVNILEEEKQKEDELINLFESNLKIQN